MYQFFYFHFATKKFVVCRIIATKLRKTVATNREKNTCSLHTRATKTKLVAKKFATIACICC